MGTQAKGPPAAKGQLARSGETAASTEGEADTPKLPHEHDQSTDQAPAQPRKVIEQAHKDVQRGLQDTDRGPPADDAYRKQKR